MGRAVVGVRRDGGYGGIGVEGAMVRIRGCASPNNSTNFEMVDSLRSTIQ